MRKQSRRVLISLCASHPRSAVQNFLSDVKRLNAEELQTLLDETDAVEQVASESSKTAAATKSGADGSPSARIIHLMRAEAGLPDQEAISEIRMELGRPDRDTPPPGKLSLEEWLRRAFTKVPSGEIIGAALSISNRKRPRRIKKASG